MASTINADNGAISGSAGLKSTADSSGVLGLQTNGTTRLTIDTSGNVGVGTTAPTTKLTLSANTALPSAGAPTGTQLWQVAADSGTNAITLDTFAGGAFIYGRRANGTAASPSAIAGADSTILRISGRGYGTTGYSSGDRIELGMYSAAAWTDASQSTYFVWKNTPVGSTTLTEVMRLDSAGNLGIGATPATRLHAFGGSLATGGTGFMFAGPIATGRLVSGGGDTLNAIHSYFDNQAYELSAGSSSGYVSGVVVGARSYTGTGGDAVTFWTRSAERMRLDASGNLGLGVTPSSWGAGYTALEIGGSQNGYLAFNPTNLQSYIYWNAYYNGTNNIYKKSQRSAAYGYDASGNFVWFQAGSGTAGNPITYTQAMTLDASGNLGVGVTSPLSKLEVRSGYITAGTAIATASAKILAGYYSTDGALTTVGSEYSSGGAILGYAVWPSTTTLDAFVSSTGINIGRAAYKLTGGTHKWFIGGTQTVSVDSAVTMSQVMMVDTNGHFLFGTTTGSATSGPGIKLIASTTDPYSAQVCTVSNSSYTTYHLYSTGAGAYRFYVNGAGTILATSTTISAISDIRLKENIRDLDDGLNIIMQLKPRKFDWKPGKGKDVKNDRGWIAQEFEQVLPEMIGEWKDPAPEGEEPYKSVQADLIPILVKAIQELNAKVAALEAAQ